MSLVNEVTDEKEVTQQMVRDHVEWLLQENGDYTVKALSKKLNKKFRHNQSLNKIIVNDLVSLDIINDERYIKRVIKRYSSNPTGINIIKSNLYKKGFPKSLIDEHMSNIGKPEQIANARKERVRKFGTGKITDGQAYQKACRHLIGKGFDLDTIKQVLGEVTHFPAPL